MASSSGRSERAAEVLSPRERKQRGQAIVLLLIVLAIIAGIIWWLFSSRAQSQENAREFARVVGSRLATHFDRKFLDARLGQRADVQYPPSFRERFFERLRRLGVAQGPFTVNGEVFFTSYFFTPNAQLRVQLDYPNAPPAYLDVEISRPKMQWQIDYLNLTYDVPPPPAPLETATPIVP